MKEGEEGFYIKPNRHTPDLTAAPTSEGLVLPRYKAVHTEDGAYLKRFSPKEEYHHLVQVYGDNVHQNNSHHTDGFISDNKSWKVQLRLLVSQYGL